MLWRVCNSISKNLLLIPRYILVTMPLCWVDYTRITTVVGNGDAVRLKASMPMAHLDERRPWRASPGDGSWLERRGRKDPDLNPRKLQSYRPRPPSCAQPLPSQILLRRLFVERRRRRRSKADSRELGQTLPRVRRWPAGPSSRRTLCQRNASRPTLDLINRSSCPFLVFRLDYRSPMS